MQIEEADVPSLKAWLIKRLEDMCVEIRLGLEQTLTFFCEAPTQTLMFWPIMSSLSSNPMILKTKFARIV